MSGCDVFTIIRDILVKWKEGVMLGLGDGRVPTCIF